MKFKHSLHNVIFSQQNFTNRHPELVSGSITNLTDAEINSA